MRLLKKARRGEGTTEVQDTVASSDESQSWLSAWPLPRNPARIPFEVAEAVIGSVSAQYQFGTAIPRRSADHLMSSLVSHLRRPSARGNRSFRCWRPQTYSSRAEACFVECQTVTPETAFGVVGRHFSRGECRKNQVMCKQGALYQCRMNPAQGLAIISGVWRILSKRSHSFSKSSRNLGMTPMQMPRCCNRLLERSEHHGKHDLEMFDGSAR